MSFDGISVILVVVVWALCRLCSLFPCSRVYFSLLSLLPRAGASQSCLYADMLFIGVSVWCCFATMNDAMHAETRHVADCVACDTCSYRKALTKNQGVLVPTHLLNQSSTVSTTSLHAFNLKLQRADRHITPPRRPAELRHAGPVGRQSTHAFVHQRCQAFQLRT